MVCCPFYDTFHLFKSATQNIASSPTLEAVRLMNDEEAVVIDLRPY